MLCAKGGFEILKTEIRSASDLAQQEWKETDVAMMNYEQLKYLCMALSARQKCVSAENKIVWEWFDLILVVWPIDCKGQQWLSDYC